VKNPEVWFELAAVSVLAGDEPGYRHTCATMLERCESVNLRRFLVARACTLAKVSNQELMQATILAMPELDRSTDRFWSLTERAALLCREGKHREALPLLEKSVEVSSNPEHAIVTWVWLSRAHLSLGEHDTAKIWLGKAADWLDQSDIKPENIHLHNWLEAQILRHEIETELAP
jgi:tetratricopeptide (TPR) repeat protein